MKSIHVELNDKGVGDELVEESGYKKSAFIKLSSCRIVKEVRSVFDCSDKVL